MIKKGFTLAEVIVTLGIIGVVAALTLPTLIQNTADRQIGPKLFNAVSVLESANVSLMGHEYDRLDSNPDISNGGNLDLDKYVKRLESVIKGSASGSTFTTKNGISYTVFKNISDVQPSMYGDYMSNGNGECFPSNEKIMNVEININADNSGNNVIASDMFYFSLMADGTLKPFGSANWQGCSGAGDKWDNHCPDNQAPIDPIYCSGSIYANGGKVMYK